MFYRQLVVLMACATAAATFPLSAGAALISKFSYTVTGGTFNGPNSTGPITGGSASFTPQEPIDTATPATRVSVRGTINLTLNGPSGFFRLFPRPGSAAVGLRSHHTIPFASTRFWWSASTGHRFGARTGLASASLIDRLPVGYAGGASVLPHCSGLPCAGLSGIARVAVGAYRRAPLLYDFATLGNEVRTVVPEPTTASLLGLGLLALAFGGGGAAGVRRMRRR
jgi:hypothetical protein